MASSADPHLRSANRVRVLGQLREHLETAEDLTRSMRQSLVQGDVDSIHTATSRLETVALEYKLLAREILAMSSDGEDGADDPGVAEARFALEEVATRVACSSAVAGGMLERMVMVSRNLLSLLGGSSAEGYTPSGRGAEYSPTGLRMTEQA